jgi:tetratricopeptide (TPR) repeat protein
LFVLEKTHEENALECFNKALEINEKYAPAWAYKGRLLLVISNYEEALKHFDKALELQQKSSYWDGRAFCLFYLKRVYVQDTHTHTFIIVSQ